jgi:hypothetical protein
LPAVCGRVSACVQRGLRTCFENAQSLNTTSIEHTGIIKLGHQTKQCVETADFFRIFPSPPIAQHGKSAIDDMGKVRRCLSACATGAVPMTNDISVGEQFWLRAVRKARDGTRRSDDLASGLAGNAHGSRDQKTENPDCTLVSIASLRGLVHGAFRMATDGCQLRSQIAVEAVPLRARSHGGEIWFDRSRGLPHECERKIAVRSGSPPINEPWLGCKFCLGNQCLAGEGGKAR